MEIRTDPNVTTAGSTSTPADVRDLHAVPTVDDAGEGVTVAVMDTGVDDDHETFDGVAIEQHDFTGEGPGDAVGHGTAVAGTIADLAPAARLVSLRVFGDAGRTTMAPIAEAYDWLVDNAAAIDLGTIAWGADRQVEAIDRRHQRLRAAGIQDVVAAGNTGARGGSPATEPGAFSVGAVTETGELTRFSSYDPDRDNPDVAAIGHNLRLARAAGTSLGQPIDQSWVRGSGTSFAAGVTTGLAARFLSAGGTAVAPAFEATARDIPSTPEDGEGIVDLGRASRTPIDQHTASAMTWDFLGTDVIHVNADWFPTDDYTAVRVDERTIRLLPEEPS